MPDSNGQPDGIVIPEVVEEEEVRPKPEPDQYWFLPAAHGTQDSYVFSPKEGIDGWEASLALSFGFIAMFLFGKRPSEVDKAFLSLPPSVSGHFEVIPRTRIIPATGLKVVGGVR